MFLRRAWRPVPTGADGPIMSNADNRALGSATIRSDAAIRTAPRAAIRSAREVGKARPRASVTAIDRFTRSRARRASVASRPMRLATVRAARRC